VKPIFKLFYRIYRIVSAVWYWMRRRFTLAGLCVAGGFLVVAGVGTDIENTVTYQTFALLLALLVLSFAFSRTFRGTFSVTRILPRLGTAGQPLHYRVLISNRSKRPQPSLTLLEDLEDPRPPFQEWLAVQLAENRRAKPFRFNVRRRTSPFKRVKLQEGEIPPLLPGGETEVHLELTPLRRGVLRFKGVTLARPDPFGLFRSLVRTPAVQTVLVLPKRHPLAPIALPGSMKYQEGGVALAANVGRSEEFVALREYRHGDPMRHIHWRSWAKTGKPIVKEFEDEFFVRHALVLDTFDDEPHSEILEEAVSVAASFACAVLTQESLLDLLFVGNQSYCFTAGRGFAHADQMLEILAAATNCTGKSFETLEQLVLNHVSAVSGCICVFQRWDDARKTLITKLRRLNIPLLVLVIVRPGEAKLDAGPLRDEPDRFHVLEMGRIAEQLARLQ